MKIPETSANVGAYYGNEENGQWQPNGVMVDSGVGGGSVGSGDARVLRPPVYHPVPRPHVPGYVMAGPYYPPPAGYAVPAPPPDDFEDYMWMENEEEFDKQVMQQLEEEALMEQCIEAMLEDEHRERQNRPVNGHTHYPTTSNGNPLSLEETVSRSTLNPLAAEFVPTGARQPSPPPEENKPDKTESPSEDSNSEEPTAEQVTHSEDTSQKSEETTPETETPEVSVADLQSSAESTTQVDAQQKESKQKVDLKKTTKPDSKVKAKAKTEVKTAPKKKSEPTPAELAKPQQSPTEEVSQPGIKPINYAAAARANKPKKATSPPATEKTTPPPQKVESKPRKNSTK